jgi:L-ascorbate metabolism protein UlaG (beta-lactamase superfamily)
MPELVYHGWSCFTLTTARGLKTVFDPNWTKPFGRPSAGPAAFADADLCLVTHGHFDHIQDVPGLMKDSRMALAASPRSAASCARPTGSRRTGCASSRSTSRSSAGTA